MLTLKNEKRQGDCKTSKKPIFGITQKENEFGSEMKAIEGLHVIRAKSLGINKIKEEEKLKIVIPENV